MFCYNSNQQNGHESGEQNAVQETQNAQICLSKPENQRFVAYGLPCAGSLRHRFYAHNGFPQRKCARFSKYRASCAPENSRSYLSLRKHRKKGIIAPVKMRREMAFLWKKSKCAYWTRIRSAIIAANAKCVIWTRQRFAITA